MPFAPAVQYRGDQYLAQGISSAGQAIGQGIDEMAQRLKQTKAMRTMAVDGLGMDPEEVDKMSLPQLQGHFQGVALKQAQEQRRAQMEDVMSQTHERDAIAQWRTAQAGRLNDEDNASQAMMEHLAGMGRSSAPQLNPEMVQGMMGSVTPTNATPVLPGAPAQARWSPEVQAILESGAAMGRSNPRVASTVLKEVLPQVMGEGSAKRSQFFDKGTVAEDVPGMPGYKRVVTGPNSSTVQYMGEDVGVPVPQHDDAGSLIGYSMRDAKGHSTFTKFKGDSQIKVATDEQGNTIPGYYRMGDKVIDTRTAIQKLAGNSDAAAGAAAKALPLPGSKAELKKDQVYTTAKGPAKWDGSQFVPLGQ